MPSQKKRCFVICPIDKDNSNIRRRSDDLLKHIIEPILKPYNYKVERSDLLYSPTQVTTNIFDELTTADLVIADLTGNNPNVFYEMAIRHSVNKPIIHMMEIGPVIPFDVGMQRTIRYSTNKITYYEKAKQELEGTMEALKNDPKDFDNPYSNYSSLYKMSTSGTDVEKMTARFIQEIASLRSQVNRQEERLAEIEKKPKDVSLSQYPGFTVSNIEAYSDMPTVKIDTTRLDPIELGGYLYDPNTSTVKTEEKKKEQKVE